MIKVSRGSRRDIVWETDGLLFYCDMTGWMNNKNGGRGRIFVRGSWLEEKEHAVIEFSGRERGRKVDSGGVCNQRDKAKRTSAVKRQVLCEKKKQHTSPFPLSVEICKLLIQNTIPRSFLPEQDRWPESHFHCSATLSWQLIWNSAISNPLHTVCQGIMYIIGFMAPLIWQIPWFLKPKDWRYWMKAWVSVLWELWGMKYNEDLDYRRQ